MAGLHSSSQQALPRHGEALVLLAHALTKSQLLLKGQRRALLQSAGSRSDSPQAGSTNGRHVVLAGLVAWRRHGRRWQHRVPCCGRTARGRGWRYRHNSWRRAIRWGQWHVPTAACSHRQGRCPAAVQRTCLLRLGHMLEVKTQQSAGLPAACLGGFELHNWQATTQRRARAHQRLSARLGLA